MEDKRIKEAFIDMLYQSCGDYKYNETTKRQEFVGFDSMCLSAYEDALELAVELEWIKKEDVTR
jgi:hypothetical protein